MMGIVNNLVFEDHDVHYAHIFAHDYVRQDLPPHSVSANI